MTFNFEEISFQIIAYAGEAKGFAMQAIELAKQNQFKDAYQTLDLADQSMILAEKTHMGVISAEANGEKIDFPVLFVHAEDQLLTTQTIMLLANEFIALYERLAKVEKLNEAK